MSKVIPRDEAIVFPDDRYLVSETDINGVITYCNDFFTEISGYSREELIGNQHNIIRHPDMPKVIFKVLWDRLKAGKNINVLVKNLAKDGRYYWIVTEFKMKQIMDRDAHRIIGYTAHRRTVSSQTIEAIEPIYKKLKELEEEKSIEETEKYLHEYLASLGKGITILTLLDNAYRLVKK